MICRTYDIQGGKDAAGKLTVYIRDITERFAVRERPLVLVCPGGGYTYTSVREGEPVALAFAGMGYHAAVLAYSCAPAEFPTALCELAESVALIRSHAADWHVDPDRVIVCGFSAGGHLAGCLGSFWNTDWLEQETGTGRALYRPDGLILCYPVITSGKYAHSGSIDSLLGSRKEDRKLRELVSLEKQVTEDFPGTFLWGTFEDELVPVQNSILLLSALAERGIPAEYHLFRSGHHGLAAADWSTRSAVRQEDAPAHEWLQLADGWIQKGMRKNL